jgi:hypothetical protein
MASSSCGFTAEISYDQRHNQPDSGVGCTPDHRGISLGWAPRYMTRDRDRIYGAIVTRRLPAMGIRDKPTAPASPWQNGLPNGISDRSGASVWTTSLFRARHMCGAFQFLCRLQQLRPNASVVAQGCSDFPSVSADRFHKLTHTQSQIRSRLGFRYTQAMTKHRSQIIPPV